MLREEAIRVLEEFQVIDDWTMVHLPPMEDAVNMAIKALEDIERWRTWSHTYDNLISRQDAIEALIEAFADTEDGDEKIECGAYWYHGTVISTIKALPSTDAVEVVRCGECKHMIADGRCMEFADDGIRPSATDFCSYGERREDGEA